MAKDEITRRQFGRMATRMLTGGALAMNLDNARIPDVNLQYETETKNNKKNKGGK